MNTLHTNFNGGLMSPRLAGRFDLEKLRSGCVQLENMIPTPFGGLAKRPGLVYAKGLGTSDGLTAISFKSSVSSSTVIVLGDSFGFVDQPQTTLSVAWSSGRDYLVGDVVTASGSSWYCKTPLTSTVSPSVSTPEWLKLTGALANPSLSTVTDIHFATPWDSTNSVRYTQTNDVMFLVHPSYPPQRLSFRGDSYGRYDSAGTLIAGGNWVLEPVEFEFAPALDLNKTLTSLQIQYDGINEWANTWVITTAYLAGDIAQGIGATAGRIYRCILAHTSAATSQPGVGATWTTFWVLVANSYAVGDRVTAISGTYITQIFTCHTAHGAATTDAVDEPGVGSAWQSYWNLGTSSTIISNWAAGQSYVAGNKRRRGKVIYECGLAHISASPKSTINGKTGGNEPAVGANWTAYWKVSSAGTDLAGLKFKLVATEDAFTTNDVGNSWLLEVGTTGRYDSFSLAAGTTIGPDEPLFIQGGYQVTTTWNSASAMIGSLTLEESFDGVNWQKIKEWNQAAANDGNISYSGDAPDIGAWYRIGAQRTSGGTGGMFKIEASSAVLKIPFIIDSYVSATEVKGRLVTINEQLPTPAAIGVSTTAYRKPAFSPTEGYPRAVCFHDGRIWYAGTVGKSSRIWASRLDDFYNFLTGANDDAGLDLTLAATERNEILWMASHNRALIVGTAGQEWTIDGGDAETVITPTKSRARLRTRHGSSGVAPALVAESLLFFTRSNAQLREFTYNFQIDGFTAPDMSQLQGGLYAGVKQAVYTSTPFPVLWVVDNNGVLWSFVYDREQNVTAWSKHSPPSDCTFVSVAVDSSTTAQIPDTPAFVIKRVKSGVTNLFLAKFSAAATGSALTDSYFGTSISDSGVNRKIPDSTMDLEIYNNSMSLASGNTTCSGIAATYLNGRTVRAFDGISYSPTAVCGATSVTFAGWRPKSLIDGVYIGECITAKIQTFPLEMQLQDGTGQGRNWRPNRIQFILNFAQFGEYADNPDGPFFDIEYPASTEEAFTGRIDAHIDANWTDTTAVTLRHSVPGPFGLLGYVLKGEISGS